MPSKNKEELIKKLRSLPPQKRLELLRKALSKKQKS